MKVTEVVKLAKQFGINVRKTKRIIKGVYRIEASNGKSFALKSMAYSSAQIRWMDNSLQGLRRAGFTQLSWRNPSDTEGKKLFVRSSGTPYILTPWIQGRWPSPQSREDMRTCGVTLAHFHRTGLIAPSKNSVMNMIGMWPAELHIKHKTLARHINLSRKSHHLNDLHSVLRAYGAELLDYSRQAQVILQKSLYSQECKKAEQLCHLCHGDGGPTNFILNPNGSFLIDFETLRIDLRAYDLYRVIYNSCKDHEWKYSIAQAILDGYHSISRLNATDLELTKAWLRFPRTTVLLLNKYHRSSSLEIKSWIAQQVPAALKSERRVTAFLKELDLYKKQIAID